MQLPKWLLQFFGDFYLHKYPGFGLYKPQFHKVKGYEIRQILDIIQPGDILLTRHNGYLNSLMTKGFWGHAAIYIGNNQIIHAIGEGVVLEDILDFCRTDNLALLRVRDNTEEKVKFAIEFAWQEVRSRVKYDYKFMSDNGNVYCTELVNLCYNGIFDNDYESYLGNNVLFPVALFDSQRLSQVLVIKH